MKRRRLRSRIIKICLGLAGFMIAASLIASVPHRIEGVYWSNRLIQCACDCRYYLRLEDGKVALYSTNHPPADLLGRYEVRPDGSIVAYLEPLRPGEPEEMFFETSKPRLGYLFIDTGGESNLLVRCSSFGEPSRLVATQEIVRSTIPDDSKIVTVYYASDFSETRRETKPIKNRKAEQGGGGSTPISGRVGSESPDAAGSD